MLARMLRVTLALQLALGALLGYALASAFHPTPGSAPGASTTALAMALAALSMPLLGSVLTIAFSMYKSRGPEPAADWWRALAGECAAAIRIFLLRQPWAWTAPAVVQPHAAAQRVPVLLVHGFVCNHRIWDDWLPVLQAQGHAVLALDLEPVFASIDDYAPRIEQAVQTLRQRSGQTQVALIGHSMGGLAIRAWMRCHGTAQVARVITLGTPHVGTQMPAWVSTPNGDQMAWQSPWIQALAASETAASRALFRIALSPQDNIVFPQRAQGLAEVPATVFPGLGHLQLCTAQRVLQWACGELGLL